MQDNLQNEAGSNSDAERLRRERLRAATESRVDHNPQVKSLAVKPGGACFAIKAVRLTGHDAFRFKPQGYEGLIGRCASAADIADAVNRINKHYQRQGFITTRAYLPEQDISSGELEIVIVPGRVEGFLYGDGRQADSRIRAAFPNDRGDLLNLRHLEQGLDNYNAPSSAKAKFQLVPGERTGGSFVQVLAEDSRRVYARLLANNDGFKSTGVVKATGTLGIDNLLELNDQISVSAATTPFDDREKRYSDTISVSAAIPYDNWSFGLDAGYSRYHFILDGINQSYPVNGHSHHVTFSAERLLSRDATSKIFAYGDLKLSRSRSFIDSFEIESQRRHLTIGSLGLRAEHLFGESRLEWDIGSKFGINAFDSHVLDKSAVDPEFRLVYGQLTYNRPLLDDKLVYKGILSGQWSNDELPGSESFISGGWSTVRGFHDDNMYGPSGINLRNTLEWKARDGPYFDVRLRSGLDIGYVKPGRLRGWDQNHIIGASLGADIVFSDGPRLTLDIAHALDRPSDFDAADTLFYAGIGFRF
ncbi:ShlB/FhaC/HecB family hemolysin secretion/activation protein [Rhizobium rhizogenes]|uniref:ShlB/FhaC/HecB family hemolysin secretion/activation protein n=1 Tax=Rhizobium rhizogenes TaxID=359 RepID=UPI0022C63BF6|nr:ShlB/FhaC/HecB family hemolysin secretion/activation protein [Rhizobium rhizogenes]MCZ7488596.1 ShlB/FhaC/HecB family hemolysin secretion/activation protein [Rhizobium rhizogenes]